ncbi:MAG: hypothetical protein HOP33_06960 [Verrucomicrobia bacterium]|nr:hypothetical protein [Verrucomicrobiota bacterium]
MEDITPPSSPTPPPATADEDKTAAIVCYLTLIGFIVAIILNSNKKTKLGAFHLRQVMGFILTGIVVWICLAIVMFVLFLLLAFMKSILVLLVPLIYLAFGVSMIVLWVLGFIAAINGQMKPMPVVGPMYQKWFGTAFE